MTEVDAYTIARGGRFYDSLKGKLLGWFSRKLGHSLAGLTEAALLVPDVVVLLCRVLLDSRVPRHVRIKVGIIVVYLVSPLDLLPEAVLGPVGLIEDLLLIVFALHKILAEVDQEVLREHWSGRQEILIRLCELADLAYGVLSGRMAERLNKWYEQEEEPESSPQAGFAGPVEVVSDPEEGEADQLERFRTAGL